WCGTTRRSDSSSWHTARSSTTLQWSAPMHALREAASAFRRTPVLTGLSAAMIALSLFVVGLFGLAAWNVREAIQSVESRVEVVAYLRADAVPAAVESALRDIEAFDEVSSVRYISRQE